jgi:cobalt-zinc-cadmium efflux system membrane fusion protein
MQAPPAPPSSRRLPKRNQTLILACAFAAILLLVIGVPLAARLFTPPPPAPPPAPPPGQFQATDEQWATLTFAPARLASFESLAQTDGKIAVDDDRTTQVFSPFSGRVTHVFVKAGETVRAGQPLFAVDAAEWVQGQSDLATALAQEKTAKAEEARRHALYETQGAALKDWQQSQSDLAAAEASLAAARKRLEILGVGAGVVDGLEKRGPGGRAPADAVVRSPVAGVVVQRSIGEGQTLASVTNGGSNAAMVVSDLSRVWLVGELREADAPKAKVGQTLQVRALALPDRTFQAKVDYVAPSVDPNSRRVAVRAEIANPDGVLKPEMFAEASLTLDGARQSVAVPENAVIYEGDTARVWVAHDGRRLELRQIQAGRAADGMVEVLSGLTPGERVATSGALFIDRASQGD